MTDTSWVVVRRRGRPPLSDSAVTRERILHAARETFAEAGYDAATFHTIAARAGLTRPAIHNYFSGKSELYREVLCRASNGVLEAIHVASERRGLGEQLLTFVRVAMGGEGTDASVAGFLVQSALHARRRPELGGDDACDAAMLTERFVRDAVSAAAERGELADGVDTGALTDLLIGVVWGTAFQISNGRSHSVLAPMDQLARLLSDAVRPPG